MNTRDPQALTGADRFPARGSLDGSALFVINGAYAELAPCAAICSEWTSRSVMAVHQQTEMFDPDQEVTEADI